MAETPEALVSVVWSSGGGGRRGRGHALRHARSAAVPRIAMGAHAHGEDGSALSPARFIGLPAGRGLGEGTPLVCRGVGSTAGRGRARGRPRPGRSPRPGSTAGRDASSSPASRRLKGGVHHPRLGAASGLLHHLAAEEAEQVALARAVAVGLLDVLRGLGPPPALRPGPRRSSRRSPARDDRRRGALEAPPIGAYTSLACLPLIVPSSTTRRRAATRAGDTGKHAR